MEKWDPEDRELAVPLARNWNHDFNVDTHTVGQAIEGENQRAQEQAAYLVSCGASLVCAPGVSSGNNKTQEEEEWWWFLDASEDG